MRRDFKSNSCFFGVLGYLGLGMELVWTRHGPDTDQVWCRLESVLKFLLLQRYA